MTNTTFTTKSGMTYSTTGTHCYKAGLDGKKTRISKTEYELAQDLYNKEQEETQKELDQSPCMVDVTSDAYKPAVIDEHGCVDCHRCNVKACVHRYCMRRNPRNVGGLGECPRLSVKVEEEEKPTEAEVIAEQEHIEVSDAELLIKAKKPSKPRASKDIAYTKDYGTSKVTLTVKQLDFLRHLKDIEAWKGPRTELVIEEICDEIGGQFTEKPMTIGAMISTLCEKGLAVRTKERVENRKVMVFSFTPSGVELATELGL